MKNAFLTCIALFAASHLFSQISQRPDYNNNIGGVCLVKGRLTGFNPGKDGTMTVSCAPDPNSCCVRGFAFGGGFYRVSFPNENDRIYKHFIVKDQIISETEIILDDKKVNIYTFELLTQ